MIPIFCWQLDFPTWSLELWTGFKFVLIIPLLTSPATCIYTIHILFFLLLLLLMMLLVVVLMVFLFITSIFHWQRHVSVSFILSQFPSSNFSWNTTSLIVNTLWVEGLNNLKALNYVQYPTKMHLMAFESSFFLSSFGKWAKIWSQ